MIGRSSFEYVHPEDAGQVIEMLGYATWRSRESPSRSDTDSATEMARCRVRESADNSYPWEDLELASW